MLFLMQNSIGIHSEMKEKNHTCYEYDKPVTLIIYMINMSTYIKILRPDMHRTFPLDMHHCRLRFPLY